MSAPTFKRRELSNAQLCFIPNGESVDSVTVAAETWPDNDPTTNFTDYEMPDIERVTKEDEIESENFMIPKADGKGYKNDDEQMVTGRKWVATTAKTNNFIKQLENGLAAAVVDATSQEYGTETDNYILGILRIVERSKTGATLQTIQVWAKMRVRSAGEVGPASKKLEIEFKEEYSSLNSFLPAA